MKFLLLLLLVGLVYLMVRFALLAGRVRREAERTFGAYRDAQEEVRSGAMRGGFGRREKDISARTRIIDERGPG